MFPAGAVAEKLETEQELESKESDDELSEQTHDEIADVVQREKYAIIGQPFKRYCLRFKRIKCQAHGNAPNRFLNGNLNFFAPVRLDRVGWFAIHQNAHYDGCKCRDWRRAALCPRRPMVQLQSSRGGQ